MKLLAIDCSTQACSVALLTQSTKNNTKYDISEKYELAARSHTERLLPMIDELLAQAQYSLSQLDAIAFGGGPGSFTGLRICLGVVQGLAYGANLPVCPISSLAALAQTALASKMSDQQAINLEGFNKRILSTIDARMDEIYWGVYDIVDSLVEVEGEERLTSPEQLVLPATMFQQNDIIAVGTGFQYKERIACQAQVNILDDQLLPRAGSIAQLACREVAKNKLYPPEQALPTYLRDQVAWTKQQ